MSKDTLTQRLMIFFFGPLIAILFILTFISQFRSAASRISNEQMIKTAQSWPAVDGTVKTFAADKVLVATGKGTSHYDYLVSVTYSYDVKNKTYESKQDKFLDHPWSFTPENVFIWWDQKQLIYNTDEKQKLESEFKTGSHHAVFYDVNYPRKSFIDVSVHTF